MTHITNPSFNTLRTKTTVGLSAGVDGDVVVADGIFPVGVNTALTLTISGSATSAVVTFNAIDRMGQEYPIRGVNATTFATGVQGGINEIWKFDITGLEKVKFTVTSKAPTNGTVLLQGNVLS